MSNILHESAEEEGTGGVHHSVTDEDVAHAGHAQRAAYVRLEPHNVMHQYTTNWRIICATTASAWLDRSKVPGKIKRSRDLEERGGAGPSS